MSIKPVDFQVMIPRTMEAAKISNDEAQRNLTTQQQQTSSTQRKVEDSLKQVYSRAQAQNARIAQKQKENRKNDGKSKKEGHHSNDSEENSRNILSNEIKISTIDIKI